MQIRDFNGKKDVVFPAVVSVFQDLGYNIKSADIATGFVNAESPSTGKKGFWGHRYSRRTTATAFVRSVGTKVQVRLNFVFTEVDSSIDGDKVNDVPVLDPALYSNAFERIENAIFVDASK